MRDSDFWISSAAFSGLPISAQTLAIAIRSPAISAAGTLFRSRQASAEQRQCLLVLPSVLVRERKIRARRTRGEVIGPDAAIVDGQRLQVQLFRFLVVPQAQLDGSIVVEPVAVVQSVVRQAGGTV
jgi:hypothetical protein